MAKKVIECVDGNGKVYGYGIECPGCGHMHVFRTVPDGSKPCWQFDGNMNAPTFSPSMLCWTPMPNGTRANICHSFVRAGKIDFLGGCTAHQMRGVYDLPDVG